MDIIEGGALPDDADWRGRLGLTFVPGKRDPADSRPYWRDLTADVTSLRSTWGVDALVLLLEDHELELLGVPEVVASLEVAGIEVVRLPIPDGGVPLDTSDMRAVLATVAGWLRDGRTVAVACRGGLGRAGTFVACLCIDAGLDAEAAIALARQTRPGTIETRRQEDFVRRWAATSGR